LKLASRDQLAGEGRKPPQAAWVKSSGRERCGKGATKASGENQRRRTTVNCHSSVESSQMTSKPGVYVNPGQAWRIPVYWACGVRHRGSASLVRALMLNCGNLRLRCKGKGASPKGETDSTNAQPRDGATRSSDELAVMAMERRGCVIQSDEYANCGSRKSNLR
jgi:hypothetical protein